MDADGNDNTPEWGYCQEPGCHYPAIPCYLSNNDPPNDPDDLLCGSHAVEHGYCAGCGRFWAGIESFDFNPAGLCEHCYSELHDDREDEEWLL